MEEQQQRLSQDYVKVGRMAIPKEYLKYEIEKPNVMEEFNKTETSNKKSSKHPSCFTINTQNKIDFANNDICSKPRLSGKSIDGMGIVKY